MDVQNNLFRDQYQRRIDSLINYINDNLGEPLSLSQLAAVSHFSPFHFHRIFKAVMDETPQDFINRVRLERSANLLLKPSSLNITQIAHKCGFSSSSTFARSFKKHFGISASAYARGNSINHGLDIYNPEKKTDSACLAIPSTEISVQSVPPMHLVYVTNMKGYSLKQICRAWEKLYRWASAHEILSAETKAVGISFDDPLITPKEKCRYYACLTAPDTIKADFFVNTLDIPRNRCVVCNVTCDAEQIELAYRYIYSNWFPYSGFQPADYPCYEIYLQTPESHPEGKYIIDICIPVTPL